VFLALAVAGLVCRRRLHLCCVFGVYLGASLAFEVSYLGLPSHYWTFDSLVLKGRIFAALTAGIPLELAYRMFRTAPRTRPMLLSVIATILFVSAALDMAPRSMLNLGDLQDLVPHLATSGLWLLVAVACVAACYRVRLHPLQTNVLVSLGLYWAVQQAAFVSMRGLNRSWDPVGALVRTFIFIATTGIWAWIAWRPDESLAPGSSSAGGNKLVMTRLG
jgi:hypothetical protein